MCLQAVTAGTDRNLMVVPIDNASAAAQQCLIPIFVAFDGLSRYIIACAQVVTAGADGGLMVVPIDDTAAAPQRIMQPRSSASYAAVRWSSPQAFVTAGTTGDWVL
jgi:hypothetical protein